MLLQWQRHVQLTLPHLINQVSHSALSYTTLSHRYNWSHNPLWSRTHEDEQVMQRLPKNGRNTTRWRGRRGEDVYMHCNCFSGISRFNCYNMSNVSQPFNSSCYLAIKDQVTSEHSLTFLFWKFQCYKWSTRALTSFFAPARWTFVVLDIIQLHFQSFFTIFDSRWPKSLCLDGEPLPPGTTAADRELVDALWAKLNLKGWNWSTSTR